MSVSITELKQFVLPQAFSLSEIQTFISFREKILNLILDVFALITRHGSHGVSNCGDVNQVILTFLKLLKKFFLSSTDNRYKQRF